jgi:GAF domain-containing protein
VVARCDSAGPTVPSPALLSAVREFTTTIANPYHLQDLLDRLAHHTVADADGAGFMLAGREGLGFAAASNDEVVEIEILQGRIDSGACREAYTVNEVVTVAGLSTHDRWPQYTGRALALGFRAVVGVPMNAGGQTIGVLNIYRRASGNWSPEQLDAAEILTAMASADVVHANQLRAQHDLAEQLQTALESRDTIGQAKGSLMARARGRLGRCVRDAAVLVPGRQHQTPRRRGQDHPVGERVTARSLGARCAPTRSSCRSLPTTSPNVSVRTSSS